MHFMNQAKISQKNQNFERAIENYKMACLTRTGAVGTQYADIANDMSWRLWNKGLKQRSIELQSESVEIYTHCLGRDNIWSLISISDLGWLYANEDRLDEAKPLLEEALNSTDEDHLWFEIFGSRLADLYERKGMLDSAESMYKRVIQAARKKDNKVYEELRTYELANLFKRQGRIAEANKLLKTAKTRFPDSSFTVPNQFDDRN